MSNQSDRVDSTNGGRAASGAVVEPRSYRYNYPAQFGDDVDALVAELRSMLLEGRYILSEEVRAFENAFAEYTRRRYARGVNSGTDSLTIALLALDIGPGDEVITHANTFHSTVAAIQLVGATPVLVDADDDSFLIEVAQARAAVTSRTKAIIPVHLYGKATDLTELRRFTEEKQIHLVEDAAQAHGAETGVAGCFSFHPSKNLAAAGDAGALVSNDLDFINRVDCLRALGQQGQNHHVLVGFNSKLDALQARILSWKLPKLEEWNSARARVAAMYRALLDQLPVRFQRVDDGETHVYHLFQVRTDSRDALLSHLRQNGVDAIVRYPTPIHLQPAFAQWKWQKGQFPTSESLAEQLLCLPIRPDMDEGEIEYVSSQVHDFFQRASA
jgi:dTDP-4-amino-4,6-dideoxygalactose transaminase